MPRKPSRTGKKPSGKSGSVRIVSLVMAFALIIPMSATAVLFAVNGISGAIDGLMGLTDEAVELRDLLLDSACPAKAARSIALEAQRNGWLPVLSVYYLPDGTVPDTGSAVLNVPRHMISAAVTGGSLMQMEITDPYQNAYLLRQAGMSQEDADAVSDRMHAEDRGLIGHAEANADGTYRISTQDGTFLLSGADGEWALAPFEEG